ncbi:MAG TPA: rhodanese-like domain-containing protein [Candidatus Limnocylindrales bacterium]|nr:rhodanese-like domain-containing protein [Candidatus Limnocylindrales bacterium]
MRPPGGIPSIDVTEAHRRLADGTNALVVDVREPGEFAAVRVEGAALFPISTFALRFGDLPRDRPLLVMCAAGSRSLAATAHLIRNGWSDVVNVAGGIEAWQRAGLPVRTGPPATGEGALTTD